MPGLEVPETIPNPKFHYIEPMLHVTVQVRLYRLAKIIHFNLNLFNLLSLKQTETTKKFCEHPDFKNKINCKKRYLKKKTILKIK